MSEKQWCNVFQIIVMSGGLRLVPELYKVPYDKVAAEKRQRGTQAREVGGAM